MLLVTGATEEVGRAVLAELGGKSVDVRVLVSDASRLGPLPENIHVVQGDSTDDETLRRALQGVEAAFLASEMCPKMSEHHARFVAAAKAVGVPRIVQLSGVGADSGMCCARILRWLGQVESAAKGTASVTHLRPTFLMQHLFKFYSATGAQRVIAGPFRSGKWTLVDARDVGAVAATILLNPEFAGRSYTVTGGEALTYQEVAERLSRVLDKPVKYVDITANEARGRLQAAGAAPVMIEATLELWDACASKLINVEPTQAVKEVTGRAPRTFEEFAQDYRERFR